MYSVRIQLYSGEPCTHPGNPNRERCPCLGKGGRSGDLLQYDAVMLVTHMSDTYCPSNFDAASRLLCVGSLYIRSVLSDATTLVIFKQSPSQTEQQSNGGSPAEIRQGSVLVVTLAARSDRSQSKDLELPGGQEARESD